jgi:hypothetical protein
MPSSKVQHMGGEGNLKWDCPFGHSNLTIAPKVHVESKIEKHILCFSEFFW